MGSGNVGFLTALVWETCTSWADLEKGRLESKRGEVEAGGISENLILGRLRSLGSQQARGSLGQVFFYMPRLAGPGDSFKIRISLIGYSAAETDVIWVNLV